MNSEVKRSFPSLNFLLFYIKNVKVRKSVDGISDAQDIVVRETRGKYNLESLKDVDIFRKYRDFFSRIGVDPTKNRPAAEALVRRILIGKPIPCINSVVDSYNLASIESEISIAAFDEEKVEGDLTFRFATKGENFQGIGMTDAMTLNGGEVVIIDTKKIIAVYPYRDSDDTKITNQTTNLLLIACGAPGIPNESLELCKKISLEYINRFCKDK